MAKYNVLFHLDEGNKPRGEMTLRNIDNLITDLGQDNVQVELVVNGEGVLVLLKSPNLLGDLIDKLHAKGVRFLACGNSLRGMGLTQEDLLPLIEIVPAGVGELARKQAEGWGYIRP